MEKTQHIEKSNVYKKVFIHKQQKKDRFFVLVKKTNKKKQL